MPIRMSEQFFHIASVRFCHEYVGGEVLEGISVRSAGDVAQRLRNLRLLLKPFAGGVHILSADPELLRGEEGTVGLRIELADRFFYNYTDLGGELRPGRQLLFFSNKKAEQSGGNLAGQEFGSSADGLDILNQAVVKDLFAKLSKGEIKLVDSEGTGVLLADFGRFVSELGEKVFYALAETGEKRGYYKPLGAMDRPPFGLVSLDFDGLYQAYRALGGTVYYQVRFKSRRTFWKYILSDKALDKFSSLAVVDPQSTQIQFREGEFEMQADWRVRSFESEVEIPYQADFNARFQLVERPQSGNRAGKVIYKQLPKASPEQLYQFPNDKQVSYSHIFI